MNYVYAYVYMYYYMHTVIHRYAVLLLNKYTSAFYVLGPVNTSEQLHKRFYLLASV